MQRGTSGRQYALIFVSQERKGETSGPVLRISEPERCGGEEKNEGEKKRAGSGPLGER